jgi:hypothetical protein
MNDKTLVERLRRKVQKLPAQGSGFMSVDGGGNVTSGGHIYDDGKRLVNPDGLKAADTIEAQATRIEALEAALRECIDVMGPMAKRPNVNPWLIQAKQALEGSGNG